jgi:hypothetical protein
MLLTKFNTKTVMLLTAIILTAGPSIVPTPASEPPAAPAEKKQEAKIKWEYKAATVSDIEKLAPKGSQDKLTDGLNALGAQGWELVAIAPHFPDAGVLGGPGMPAAGRGPMPPGGPGMVLNVKPINWVFKRVR